MENGNFVYKGWKCNGFLALTLIFVGLALGVCAIVFGAQRIDAGLAFGVGPVVIGSVWCLCMLICMAGFMLLEPNEARVMVFFGKYKGTFYETGYWWVNPFMSGQADFDPRPQPERRSDQGERQDGQSDYDRSGAGVEDQARRYL